MNILVIGGTRFFGIPMVRQLLKDGHQVTIATRGTREDLFGDQVSRIQVDRTDAEAVRTAFSGKHAVLSKQGDPAPYNGEPAYSIDTKRADAAGFVFTRLHDWIYELLDYYITESRGDRAYEE